ncbi:MAG: fibronectin type III domain-containing protein [Chloroflexota bacterium]|nr:fibronectin type III domain-containing protein [Chloroflexota bacterium]
MPKLSGDHVQALVDGYDITGDSNQISINEDCDVFDVTVFGDKAHKFAPGQRMMAVRHAGFMNSGEAGSHPALKGLDVDGLFSVYVGENAEPAVGGPVFSMLTRQGRYGALPQVNQVIPFRAAFANRSDDGGWGIALANPRHVIGSSRGSAVDNGAATDGGGLACLHVLETAASDAYTFSIEGSDSGAFAGEENVLATFALDGRTIGSEQVKIDGRIPRRIRWVATADPAARDRIKIAISLIRTHAPVVLPAAVTPSPQGLLADFQFTARIPSGNPETAAIILEGYNRRTGVHWLFLTKQDGAKTDMDLAGLAWDAAGDAPTSNSFGQGRPAFFGGGDHDWQLLPTLLPNSSFYIYLPRDEQIYEFAVAANNEASNYFLSFATTPRPASVVTGSPMRVLVADSGQANLIQNWIGAGNRPEVIAPPAKPRSPSLASGDGQATVTITPPDSGGAPISSYELNYRAVGSKAYPNFMGNLSGEPITVADLTNDKPYEFRVLAVNRGGRGPWSAYASVIPSSSPRPQGLLAYFQFVARVPATWNLDYAEIILEGYHNRSGAHVLQLTKKDGNKSDIPLNGIAWEAADDTHTSNFFGRGRPTFFGGGDRDWQLLPTLLPNSSFYIYLPSNSQIWEFPVTANNEAANHFLSFSSTPRPDSILNGSTVSVLVADSGQANRIKDWIAADNQPEVIEPPAKPQPPTLAAGDGQVTVTVIPPAQGGAPITTYELGYREVGSGIFPRALSNLTEEPYVVSSLINGKTYEFRIAALNRGGYGPWSGYAAATPQS